eukprot:PhF_6_TR13394/c0_g1_i1/m.21282
MSTMLGFITKRLRSPSLTCEPSYAIIALLSCSRLDIHDDVIISSITKTVLSNIDKLSCESVSTAILAFKSFNVQDKELLDALQRRVGKTSKDMNTNQIASFLECFGGLRVPIEKDVQIALERRIESVWRTLTPKTTTWLVRSASEARIEFNQHIMKLLFRVINSSLLELQPDTLCDVLNVFVRQGHTKKFDLQLVVDTLVMQQDDKDKIMRLQMDHIAQLLMAASSHDLSIPPGCLKAVMDVAVKHSELTKGARGKGRVHVQCLSALATMHVKANCVFDQCQKLYSDLHRALPHSTLLDVFTTLRAAATFHFKDDTVAQIIVRRVENEYKQCTPLQVQHCLISFGRLRIGSSDLHKSLVKHLANNIKTSTSGNITAVLYSMSRLGIPDVDGSSQLFLAKLEPEIHNLTYHRLIQVVTYGLYSHSVPRPLASKIVNRLIEIIDSLDSITVHDLSLIATFSHESSDVQDDVYKNIWKHIPRAMRGDPKFTRDNSQLMHIMSIHPTKGVPALKDEPWRALQRSLEMSIESHPPRVLATVLDAFTRRGAKPQHEVLNRIFDAIATSPAPPDASVIGISLTSLWKLSFHPKLLDRLLKEIVRGRFTVRNASSSLYALAKLNVDRKDITDHLFTVLLDDVRNKGSVRTLDVTLALRAMQIMKHPIKPQDLKSIETFLEGRLRNDVNVQNTDLYSVLLRAVGGLKFDNPKFVALVFEKSFNHLKSGWATHLAADILSTMSLTGFSDLAIIDYTTERIFSEENRVTIDVGTLTSLISALSELKLADRYANILLERLEFFAPMFGVSRVLRCFQDFTKSIWVESLRSSQGVKAIEKLCTRTVTLLPEMTIVQHVHLLDSLKLISHHVSSLPHLEQLHHKCFTTAATSVISGDLSEHLVSVLSHAPFREESSSKNKDSGNDLYVTEQAVRVVCEALNRRLKINEDAQGTSLILPNSKAAETLFQYGLEKEFPQLSKALRGT